MAGSSLPVQELRAVFNHSDCSAGDSNFAWTFSVIGAMMFHSEVESRVPRRSSKISC